MCKVSVEINRDHPNENKQKLFRAQYSTGITTVTFGRDSEAEREDGRLYSGKASDVLRLTWQLEAFHVIGLGGSSVFP